MGLRGLSLTPIYIGVLNLNLINMTHILGYKSDMGGKIEQKKSKNEGN
jgi:hypothetical protein